MSEITHIELRNSRKIERYVLCISLSLSFLSSIFGCCAVVVASLCRWLGRSHFGSIEPSGVPNSEHVPRHLFLFSSCAARFCSIAFAFAFAQRSACVRIFASFVKAELVRFIIHWPLMMIKWTMPPIQSWINSSFFCSLLADTASNRTFVLFQIENIYNQWIDKCASDRGDG